MVRKAVPAADTDGNQPATAAGPSFEDAIGELEALVQRMESGSLSLEDSLAAYRRGTELVTHCRGALAAVQHQVRILEGELLRPLDLEADDAGVDQ